MAVRNCTPRHSALDVVMFFECADNIVKGAVARIGKLDPNCLAQLVLEGVCAAFLHLRFGKCLLIPNLVGIFVVEILAHGIQKTVFDTLLPEILRHFIKVALIAAVGFAVLHIAIADKKMRVNVIGIGVDGKQDFVAFLVSKFFGKLPRYPICGHIIHVIIGVE